MEAILQALGRILLTAIPTIVLLIFVHIYLKYVFFRPLAEVLRKRRELTEGAREAAQRNLNLAAEKAAMYEIALKDARAGIYKEQEETRRKWLDHHSSRIEAARHRTQALVHEAGQKLEQEIASAKAELASSSQTLAEQITDMLMGRRAAR